MEKEVKKSVVVGSNGEVTVNSDWGVIKENGEHNVVIQGEYVIDADSVKNLMLLKFDGFVCSQTFINSDNPFWGHQIFQKSIRTSNEDIKFALECLENERTRLQELDSERKVEYMEKELRFNKRAHRINTLLLIAGVANVVAAILTICSIF